MPALRAGGAEIADGRRIIARGAYWLCYVPFAARWPYEVRIAPWRHVGRLDELAPPERDELAGFYPRMLRRFDLLFDRPAPYIAGWEQADRAIASLSPGEGHRIAGRQMLT